MVRDVEIAAERKEALDILELLWCHLGSAPVGTEWVYWVPREYNCAADTLANRAMDEKADGQYVNARCGFKNRSLVGVSDAGVREEVGGWHVGMGWMIVDRETRECVCATHWYRWEGSGQVARQDVNVWEMRAAKSCVAAMVAIRVGRLAEVVEAGGREIPLGVRRNLKRQLFHA